jgi:transposase
MSKLRFIGLDVHKDSIVAAVADAGSAAAEGVGSWLWDEVRVLKELQKLGPLSTLKVCYEAGPTGYGLARSLQAAGVDCVVVAPGLVPQVAGSRIKTDRRDAKKLAHFLRSGDLTVVWLPDEQTEALRDLERARDDARLAERRIKQQLLKFLLRHGRRYDEGKENWTKTHWTWVRQQKFEHEAQQRVLADAITTTEHATARIAKLDADIAECIEGWALAPLVKNLQAFRGIKLLTAVGIAAEIGDFARFPKAGNFMGYVGLVPSENSSGQSRRQGGITKTGNRHVRRLLIEAAWHYFNAPLVASAALTARRVGVSEEVIAIADRALRRLRKKCQAMQLRKKSGTKIVTALARELAGFVWAAARVGEAIPSASGRSKSLPPVRTPAVTERVKMSAKTSAKPPVKEKPVTPPKKSPVERAKPTTQAPRSRASSNEAKLPKSPPAPSRLPVPPRRERAGP